MEGRDLSESGQTCWSGHAQCVYHSIRLNLRYELSRFWRYTSLGIIAVWSPEQKVRLVLSHSWGYRSLGIIAGWSPEQKVRHELSHSWGIPRHLPPKLGGAQDPSRGPDLKSPKYFAVHPPSGLHLYSHMSSMWMLSTKFRSTSLAWRVSSSRPGKTSWLRVKLFSSLGSEHCNNVFRNRFLKKSPYPNCPGKKYDKYCHILSEFRHISPQSLAGHSSLSKVLSERDPWMWPGTLHWTCRCTGTYLYPQCGLFQSQHPPWDWLLCSEGPYYNPGTQEGSRGKYRQKIQTHNCLKHDSKYSVKFSYCSINIKVPLL